MKHSFGLRVGPVGFRIGSAWKAPLTALSRLYEGYPPADIPDFTVRLEPPRPWRRWLRPSVAMAGDYTLAEALPLPLAQALLAAEMGMNMQMALGQRRYLLLHAAAVERDGRALIITGDSGSGKSTLSALLGEAGWRFMGDEFVLIDPASGKAHPFPRPVSLKNAAIAVVASKVTSDRLGPLMRETPKGDIRHLRPSAEAIAAMDTSAAPALILLPRFGESKDARAVARSEVFVRLTQASTNYTALGENGFNALTKLITSIPAVAIDYPDSMSGIALAEQLWQAL